MSKLHFGHMFSVMDFFWKISTGVLGSFFSFSKTPKPQNKTQLASLAPEPNPYEVIHNTFYTYSSTMFCVMVTKKLQNKTWDRLRNVNSRMKGAWNKILKKKFDIHFSNFIAKIFTHSTPPQLRPTSGNYASWNPSWARQNAKKVSVSNSGRS